jgi:penicillin-binding protein 1A
MPDMQDKTDRASDIGSEHSRDRATRASRSAAAGREFVNALGDDVVALAARLRRSLTTARLRLALAVARRRQARALPRPNSAARSSRPSSSSASWASASGRVLRRVGLGVALAGIVGMLALSGAMLWALHGLPLDRPMSETDKPSLLLEAANGEPLGRVGPFRAADAALQDFPPLLIQAVLSIEDRRFYHHFGVDPFGILRAAHRNAVSGGIAEGGSTITQQLVKRRYVGDDRTYTRKLREAMTAIWLESHLGKDEILTRYLNSVYLGAGAYGMVAAARLYFDKRPADLTLAEAAMLAGLIKAPSQLNPLSHLDDAQARAAMVLDTMLANGAIDAQAATVAKARPATTKLAPQQAPAASWFTDWIATQAAGVNGSRTSSVRVRTTLMPDLQRLAQDILDDALAKQGRGLGVSQGALVAMRPDGAVLAMVGGRDYATSQFNRAVDAKRQPGSAFKLFVYLAALRNGYTPQDMIDAGPIDIKGWEPENYGDAHYGRITLAQAFAQSVNTAAVRLAMDVGLDHVITAARDLGVDSPLSPTPSLALGAYGVTLLDLTGAFASVRADRMRVKPWGIAAVATANGAALQAAQPLAPTRTLDPYQRSLVDLLRGVVVNGTGRGAALNGFAAGKTGTSQDYHDAWFVGFNDTLIVGVWLGNDDNSPMRRVTGGSLPASIWKQFMIRATPLVGQPAVPVAAAPAPPAPQQADSAPMPQPADQPANASPVTQVASGQAAPGFCDVQACAGTYGSFRASDCTYQPFSGGPRRLCGMGARQSSPIARASAQETTGTGATGAPAQCNVDACARTYSSFDPSDCTYQPFGGGPRQLCER